MGCFVLGGREGRNELPVVDPCLLIIACSLFTVKPYRNRHHGSPRQYGQKLPAVACLSENFTAKEKNDASHAFFQAGLREKAPLPGSVFHILCLESVCMPAPGMEAIGLSTWIRYRSSTRSCTSPGARPAGIPFLLIAPEIADAGPSGFPTARRGSSHSHRTCFYRRCCSCYLSA
jgi:hypothetical protein